MAVDHGDCAMQGNCPIPRKIVCASRDHAGWSDGPFHYGAKAA
jgi:hypothetical protein